VNGCYKFVSAKLEWSAAGLNCRLLHKDAHLVVIDNVQEQAAIVTWLASVSGTHICTRLLAIFSFHFLPRDILPKTTEKNVAQCVHMDSTWMLDESRFKVKKTFCIERYR